MSDEPKESPPVGNPFATMSEEVLQKHLDYLNETAQAKPLIMTKLQESYGKPIVSDHLQKQLDTITKFAEGINSAVTSPTEETKVPSPAALTENEQRIAKIGLESVVDKVKSIDEKIPLQGILDSALSEMDKIEVVKLMIPVAQYHKDSMDTLKSELPSSGDDATITKFAEAPKEGNYDGMVERLKKYKI